MRCPTDSSPLRCPRCYGTLSRLAPMCDSCHFQGVWEGRVLDLRLDRAQDTQLEPGEYDASHPIDESGRALYAVYEQALLKYGQMNGTESVLELGAGSGNLTRGILAAGRFRHAHISDISPRFMQGLMASLQGDARTHLHAYLFDANAIPFSDRSLNVVLGHSILHHVLHFEETIQDVQRTLTANGIAIFGEPTLDSQYLYFFIARLATSLAEAGAMQLSPKTRFALEAISKRGDSKLSNLIDREAASRVEDKFVFASQYMRALAERCGFSNYQLFHGSESHDVAAVIQRRMLREVTSVGGFPEEMKQLDPVIEALSRTQTDTVGPFLPPMFAYHVFING